MSLSGVCRDQMEAKSNVNRLRNCLPEKLEDFCKMHLSFLLDRSVTELDELFGDCSSKHKNPLKKKAPTPFSKKKESPPQMGNRFPTREQVAQIYQLSEFLQLPEYIRTEGLFRKTGNLARQQLLKEWVNQGADLRLDDGLFSPHDCANVLKSCISALPGPLLTVKHFEAHCQIVDMSNNVTPDEDRSNVNYKQIKALQLLFLLIPRQNAIVLECLLDLLRKVSNVSENLMTAHSLGMVFAPSLICPKKLTSLEFHSMSDVINKAVSFMIESTPFLFKIPRELAVDVGKFWQEMEESSRNVFTEEFVPQKTNVHISIQKTKKINFNSKELMSTYVKTPEKKIGELVVKSASTDLLKIDTPAVHTVDHMSCLQMQQTPTIPDINNATWQDKMEQQEHKNLLMSSEKETDLIFKVQDMNVTQWKPTAVVSPIAQCIKISPKSTQMEIMTPRSRTPITLHFPMKYLESDL